jgi:hypothetical protein
MLTDMHCAAYVLSPAFLLASRQLKDPAFLPAKERLELLKRARQYMTNKAFRTNAEAASSVNARINVLLTSNDDPETNAALDLELASNIKSPIAFWRNCDAGNDDLNRIGIRVCSQISASSVTERIWSYYDFVHNKRRNRLSPRRAEMLVRIFAVAAMVRSARRTAARLAAAARLGVGATPQGWCDAEDDTTAEEEAASLAADLAAASAFAAGAATAEALAASAAVAEAAVAAAFHDAPGGAAAAADAATAE